MHPDNTLQQLSDRVRDTRILLADLEAQLGQLETPESRTTDDNGQHAPTELHAPPATSRPAPLLRRSTSTSGYREHVPSTIICDIADPPPNLSTVQSQTNEAANRALPPDDYKRYARQLIVSEIGVAGHQRIKNAKVLIVGLGGLGSPAVAYLAGAGVGTIGLVDGDVVDESNLHRQIVHSASRVGTNKALSAKHFVHRLNPTIHCETYKSHLAPHSAISTVKDYDLVLDCTDHPASRYLVSDACVIAQKPLISASALKTEGQLMVLNNPALAPGDTNGGPCYRCIFPKPPPIQTVVTCGEGGIIGPVVGVMGVMQALEAIKLIASSGPQDIAQPATSPSLLMFSAYSSPQFRNVKLRQRRPECQACSTTSTVVAAELAAGSLDYTAFCGASEPVKILSDDERISARECAERVARKTSQTIVIDVRDKTHFDLCHLKGSVNVPINKFSRLVKHDAYGDHKEILRGKTDISVICRLGNDSQIAVKALKDAGVCPEATIKDVKGGFKSWRQDVDPKWPDY